VRLKSSETGFGTRSVLSGKAFPAAIGNNALLGGNQRTVPISRAGCEQRCDPELADFALAPLVDRLFRHFPEH
jgi:hypothetical protein